MTTSTTYSITGMTCDHCVAAVTAELSELQGVEQVDVALVAGGTSDVTVTSREPLATQAVREAVAEAGYDLSETS